ncbi:hypothetical protein ACRAWF_34470 [Streptomyces sp. L7]
MSLSARVTEFPRGRGLDAPRVRTGGLPTPITAYQHDQGGRHNGYERQHSHPQVDHRHPVLASDRSSRSASRRRPPKTVQATVLTQPSRLSGCSSAATAR